MAMGFWHRICHFVINSYSIFSIRLGNEKIEMMKFEKRSSGINCTENQCNCNVLLVQCCQPRTFISEIYLPPANEFLRKVMFLHLSATLFTGGECIPACDGQKGCVSQHAMWQGGVCPGRVASAYPERLHVTMLKWWIKGNSITHSHYFVWSVFNVQQRAWKTMPSIYFTWNTYFRA